MRWVSKQDALVHAAGATGAACPMCELVRVAPIAVNEHAVAVLDRYAARYGHVLVVLRRHEEQLGGVSWDEYAGMHRLVWELCRALDDVLAPRRTYIAALGSAEPVATSFPHVHLHVVPLADGGDVDRPANVFTWQNGMYVFESDEEERALRERIAAALARTRVRSAAHGEGEGEDEDEGVPDR